MEAFRRQMEGVYSTCVLPETLDESPMAYKSMEEILAQIGPTAEIEARIRPVYNFKAGGLSRPKGARPGRRGNPSAGPFGFGKTMQGV